MVSNKRCKVIYKLVLSGAIGYKKQTSQLNAIRV
jgi:hypothetical protein